MGLFLAKTLLKSFLYNYTKLNYILITQKGINSYDQFLP